MSLVIDQDAGSLSKVSRRPHGVDGSMKKA